MNKRDIIERIDAIEAELRSCEVRLTSLRHELAKEWLMLAAPEKPAPKYVWTYQCRCGEDVTLLSLDDWTECSCGTPLDRDRLVKQEIANVTHERFGA